MDGQACNTLFEMGGGRFAGISAVNRVPLNQGIVSYEEMNGGEEDYAIPRISAQLSFEYTYLIDYDKGARVLSGVFSPDHQRKGNGMAVFNERVLILPFSGGVNYIPMALHELRRRVIFRELQKAARNFSGLDIIAEGHVNFGAYAFADKDRQALFVANSSIDSMDSVKLWRSGTNKEPAEMITRNGRIKPRCQIDGDLLTVFHRFEALECALLFF
jgi:hypothetical protein